MAARRAVPSLIALAVLTGLWQAVSLPFSIYVLPSPVELVGRMIELFRQDEPLVVIATTLMRTLIGLVVALFLGTAIGIAMGRERFTEQLFDSWMMVLLTFPAVAWAFLGVLWFGLGTLVPVFTIVLIVLPLVVLNMWEGTKATDKDLVDMGRAFKARRWMMIRKIFLPQIMPYFFAALRIAFAISWKIALVAEAFGVSVGVGRKLVTAFQELRVDLMLAWAVMFMLLMAAIEVIGFRWWEKRTFAWRHEIAA